MNCLIIDKVWGGIAEELSKCMNVKTADNLPPEHKQHAENNQRNQNRNYLR